MECAPTVKVEVDNVAFPPLRVPVPKVETPFLNVTVPVAVFGVTEAVNVTDWSKTDGLCEELTNVELAFRTSSVNIPEVLATKLPSPE